jgi:beta-exotoxin I transport system permease protein
VLRSVLLKSLRDVRRSFAWWSLGLVGMVALLVSVYPSVRDNPSLNQLVEDYPEALRAFVAFGGSLDYVSPAGYLGAELFSLVVPLVLLIAGIGAGARALAGEEERGTLDLLLSNPVSRRRLTLEKLAALVLELVGLALVLFASLIVGAHVAGMAIGASRLGAATTSALLLSLAFAAIALAVGAATGHRARAIALAAAAAVAAYLVNGLAPLVDALEPLQKASPFYHYAASDPLRHGLEAGHSLILVAIAVAAAALAPLLFDRRDLAA